MQVADWAAWDAAGGWAERGFVDCFEVVAAADLSEARDGVAFGVRWVSSHLGSLVAAVTAGSSFVQPVLPGSEENMVSASASPWVTLSAEVTQWS